ncbi:SDR family NAD(P)-dependent oxidoreductase [Dehalococcoidia bacterium]|nr:SDR family NAD(P)-dependent oxidoreductase [Dehalococcoidia bacterium]
MGNRMEGKAAIVTGGGRGIGRAVALLLAEEGASVLVNDTGFEVDGTGSSHQPADSVVAEITAKGGKAVANYDNMATMDGGESAVTQVMDSFGQLDALVTSTAVLRDAMITQMTNDDWTTVLDNTLKAAFTVTKFASVVFRQQRGGRIVTITSDAGLGAVGRVNFAAAGEALLGMNRAVARDLGRYGVTANAVTPLARTRLFPGTPDEYRRLRDMEGPDDIARLIPTSLGTNWEGSGSPDDPENAAPIAVWLCTDAAPNVNSYCWGIRGGDIYLYKNPEPSRSIHKWGNFTVNELQDLVPRTIAVGTRNPASPPHNH